MRMPIIIISFLLCSSLTGCKKYLEGPYFSLSSKASRLAGTWTVEQAFNGDGLLLTLLFDTYEFKLEKGGGIEIQFEGDSGSLQTVVGSWSLEDNKDTFQWEVSGDTLGFRYAGKEVFDILRLTNDQFWILDKDFLEIHLMP